MAKMPEDKFTRENLTFFLNSESIAKFYFSFISTTISCNAYIYQLLKRLRLCWRYREGERERKKQQKQRVSLIFFSLPL